MTVASDEPAKNVLSGGPVFVAFFCVFFPLKTDVSQHEWRRYRKDREHTSD